MRPARVLLIPAAVLLVISAAACAQTESDGPEIHVSLERSEVRDDSQLPYRTATLTLEYISSDAAAGNRHDVIRCITIRSARGGPTMLSRVTVPVASPVQKLGVLVPPLSAQGAYRVRLFAGQTADSDLLGEFDLSLDWPTGWVTAEAFVDPEAYGDGDYVPPRWSNRTLYSVFVTAAIACILLAATLLVRSAPWRVAGTVFIALAAATALWTIATSEPAVVRQPIGDDGRMLLVSCRRAAKCEIPAPHTIPLYYDLEEMADDNAVVHTAEGLTVLLAARDVLLFARSSD